MDAQHPFPDLSSPQAIDGLLERADCHGVTRRDVLKLATAASLFALGAPAVSRAGGVSAVAGQTKRGGKLAFLIMTNQLQYDVQLDHAASGIARHFGYSYTGLNGELNAQLQLSQFGQVAAAGATAVLVHSPDGSNIRAITQQAAQRKIWVSNIWGTLPWYTPFDAGDYWTLYAQPDEFRVQGEAVRVLAEALGGKGEIVRVLGVPGNTADTIRSAGADAVLKRYPQLKLVGELPGNWNSEDSQKATEALVSKHPNLKGVIAQNDDIATGVIAALRATGRVPGKDVLVTGADGTDLAAKRIASGEQLVTTANVPAYAGYLTLARLFDVQHGWKPRDAERILQWRSIILTKKNVRPYIARYVDGTKEPFNADLLSRVKHPNDWDPQFLVYPTDIDVLWTNIQKPKGFVYPPRYLAAKKTFRAVAAEYRRHYRHDALGPSPA